MPVRRVTTFNVNQFSSPDHQRADLTRRMRDSDVVVCQETVDDTLPAFASHHDGWAAFQIRHGDNDGHANTGILYRTELAPDGPGEDVFIGDVAGTRARFLAVISLDGVYYGSAHIMPARDRAGIPAQLANLGKWVDAHPGPKIIGFDRNQCPPATLENATGLKWHGVGIDGFLTNLPMANVAEFPKGFSDHPGVHADVTVPAVKPAPEVPVIVKPPAPPYLGPVAHYMHDGAGKPLPNMPVHRIVMHSTVSPCKAGGARDIAAYFKKPEAGGSAHYIVDPSEVVQSVYDSWQAEHAPPNANSLGIEMCDIPGPVPGDAPGTARYKAAKRVWRWTRPEQVQMLDRAAQLAAQLCAAYGVPPVFLTTADLLAGKHGVTTHNNVSQAWHESCVSADTPILCADLTWRPAGDLRIGDELIAFDEQGSGDQRKLRRSVVERNEVMPDELFLVNTAGGSVRCNAEHPWLARRGRRGQWGHWEWVRTSDLHPDDELMHVFEPWQAERSWEAGWLAGMYDGEGSLSTFDGLKADGRHNRTFSLTLSQRVSETADRMLGALKERGFAPSVISRPPHVDPRGIIGRHDMMALHFHARGAILRVLGTIRPPRLLAKADTVWEGGSLYKCGTRMKVESVEPAGIGKIASLTTSTRTYIAGGFAMHNTHWDPGFWPRHRFMRKVRRYHAALLKG